MVQAIKPRAKTLGDGHKPIAFALTADDAIAYDPAAVQKVIQGPAAPASKDAPPTGLTGRDVLVAMRAMLADHPPNAWSPAEIDAAISHLATTRGLGLGAAAQPLRIALTGTTISPGLGHCCAILGPTRTLTRIDRALRTLSAAR
jgi:glutamyl-tRNA synthetase